MSAAPASTAPAKTSTVSGFKPSVIIVLLPGFGGTRRFQGAGLIPDERPRARATPVPRAPIDVRFIPALQQAVHHDAAVVGAEARQCGEERRRGVSAQCHRILGVEWPL